MRAAALGGELAWRGRGNGGDSMFTRQAEQGVAQAAAAAAVNASGLRTQNSHHTHMMAIESVGWVSTPPPPRRAAPHPTPPFRDPLEKMPMP